MNDKSAAWLGTTDTDRQEALEAAAPAIAAGGAGGLGLTGALKIRDLLDRKTAPEFGSIEELVRRVNAMGDVDLPATLRVMQSNPITDPIQLGYAALPRLGADLTAAEETLHVPWDFDRPMSLRSTSFGDILPLSDPFSPGEQIVLDQAEHEARKAGEIGDWLRKFRDRFRKPEDVTLRQRKNYSPSAVLHELGHLSHSAKGKIKALQAAGMIAPAIGAGLGTAAALSDNDAVSYAAPAVAAAGMAPTLVEEARATSGARKMMANLIDEGLDASNMKRLYKALGPAYGTYALGALVPAAAVGITAKVMRDKRDRGLLGDVWAKTKDLALTAQDKLTSDDDF